MEVVLQLTTAESSLNFALAEVFDNKRANWKSVAEQTGRVIDKGRPDIIITETGTDPIIIETEFEPAATVEDDAIKKLGVIHKKYGRINTTIAVIIPKEIKKITNAQKIRDMLLLEKSFKYVIFSQYKSDEKIIRFPEDDFLKGDINDIVRIVQIVSISKEKVDTCVKKMSDSTDMITDILLELDIGVKKEIVQVLKQEYKEETLEQTIRMASLIVQNAMIFYENISGHKGIEPLIKLQVVGEYTQDKMIDAWNKVLEINYKPIFAISKTIIEQLKSDTASRILKISASTTNFVLAQNMMKSGDLYGSLFQSTISDYKLLASFYTLPESASLMSRLVFSMLDKNDISDKNITNLRIADFACGTGMLLSSVYKELIAWGESSKFDMRGLHSQIMKKVIIGFDVLPIATHMTVSALSGIFPKASFLDTKIYSLPLGKHKRGESESFYDLGSFDLINENRTIFDDAGKIITSQGDIGTESARIENESCDLIIMNPPFIRNTNHAAGRETSHPMFSAFGIPCDDQKKMGKILGQIFNNTVSHGHAGASSYFIEIANRKLKNGGVLALIVPATIASGDSWKKVRTLINENYDNILLIGIKSGRGTKPAFSSKTKMSEAMLIAKKAEKDHSKTMKIITLENRPASILEGIVMANEIFNAKNIRNLNNVYGETPLKIGKQSFGNIFENTKNKTWQFGNVIDTTLLQISNLLSNNKLCMPNGQVFKIETTILSNLAKMGPHAMSLTADFGQFDKSEYKKTAIYPSLWNNNSKTQTKIIVEPDSMLVPRKNIDKKQFEKLLASASHVHVNLQATLTSQKLCASYTERETLGGRSWPSVIFKNKEYDKSYTIWSNSTLGLLLYWYHSSRQQHGRGNYSRNSFMYTITLDFSKYEHLIKKFDKVFDKFVNKELLPISKLNKDETRIAIDDELLYILGINHDISDLRNRLCNENHFNGK